MAYYIDYEKNTAVKAEGKAIYGWNHESRSFDLPVSDPTPKSRMERTSEFGARRYLFEHDPRKCRERIRTLADKIQARPDAADVDAITVERAKSDLKAAKAFKEELLPEISILQSAIDEYGMAMSDAGSCASVLCRSILIRFGSTSTAKRKCMVTKMTRSDRGTDPVGSVEMVE